VPAEVVHALGLLKSAAAAANAELGLLPADVAGAIRQAADAVAAGDFDGQFVVDLYQTGSGTSSHRNANEVIARRANEPLTGRRQAKEPVHPNNHVHRGQSSNDAFPTAVHVAALLAIERDLLPALTSLQEALARKAVEPDVNPVVPESVCQVAARVVGNDATLTVGASSGLLELNVMMPVLADALLESLRLLAAAARLADEEGTTLRAVAERESGLSREELDRLLDPERMTRPGAESGPEFAKNGLTSGTAPLIRRRPTFARGNQDLWERSAGQCYGIACYSRRWRRWG
jgi:fumarate hydratase class II